MFLSIGNVNDTYVINEIDDNDASVNTQTKIKKTQRITSSEKISSELHNKKRTIKGNSVENISDDRIDYKSHKHN